MCSPSGVCQSVPFHSLVCVSVCERECVSVCERERERDKGRERERGWWDVGRIGA